MLKRNGTIAEFEQIVAYMKKTHPLGEHHSETASPSSAPPKAFWKVEPIE